MTLRIEPLTAHHDRRPFRSGIPSLDAWLRRQASLDGIFVAVDETLLGFYTLSPIGFAIDGDLDRPVPRDRDGAVPIALIGRLARDKQARGQKLGHLLLADALARVLDHAPNVFAIAADAPTEPARRFYGQFGFTCLPSQPSRMLLLASTAARARFERVSP